MEKEVASTIEVPKKYDIKSSNDLNVETKELLENTNQHHESPSLVTTDAAKVDVDTKESINKSGASPKLITENKTATNSRQDNNDEISSNTDSTPGDSQYFYEDEVFRIDKKGRVKFGLIVETTVDQDEEFDDLLTKGEVRVIWYPDGNEGVHEENAIGLADRTLMPGDVVRRLVPGKETQRGYCRDINMRADVRVLGTKHVIKNVNAERLRVVGSWQRDNAVYLNSWVGSIKDVEKKAIIRTANGCRIEVSSKDFYWFKDSKRSQADVFIPHVFYTGNTIVGYLPPMENIKILTPDIPLTKNKKGKTLPRKFTVESVTTESVWVHWQCKALSDEKSFEAITLQPHPCVSGDDLKQLKRLNLFESCMLQINDRCYLTFSSCDTIIKKSDWDNEQAVKFKLILQQQKEDNQKIFVNPPTLTGNTGGGGGGSGSVHNHYEKSKKKLSLGLDDKSANKLKRSLFKDKFGNTNNKEKAQENSSNKNQASPSQKKEDEWVSTEDDDDEDHDFMADHCDFVKSLKQHYNPTEDAVSTTTTMSTCSSPSPRTSPIHLTKRQMKKKARKNFKSPFLSESKKELTPKEGDVLVIETLLVYSTATVVWQDGTIESDIPSTQLYPIHHLDNHEFFPGDFVISGTEESDTNFRDYGVIQTVDHEGRITHVKWFTTYASADEPKPSYKGESEVSVYDLKDHPDFQYRPGTMVIRVANFVGDDAKCTAGQIIDNYIDGRIKVWWVDGHISMCWPQDLFEVGQYDQGDWGHESDDSWETESENSEFGGGGSSSLKLSMSESHVLSNIEKARVAVARLEEIFNINPHLQNPEVMRKLLTVYKGCRYLDRLLNTNFFHEDNFMGLIERVRRGGNQTLCDRVIDQKNRLFSDGVQTITSPNSKQHQPHYQYYSAIVAVNSCGQKPSHQSTQQLQTFNGLASKEYAPKVLFNISSTPFKCSSNHMANFGSQQLTTPSSNAKRRCSPVAAARESPMKKDDNVPIENKSELDCDKIPSAEATSNVNIPSFEISPNKTKQYNVEKNQLLNSAMLNIEKAFEKTSQLKTFIDGSGNAVNNTSTSQDDSGNYSRYENCDGSSTSCTSSSDLTNIDTNNSMTKANDNQKSISCSSIELPEDAAPELVCVRLCALLKDQLVKCLDEIREKYYKEDQVFLSEIIDIDDETMETVIDFENNHDENKKETVEHTKDDSDVSEIPNSVEKPNKDEDDVVDVEKPSNVLSGATNCTAVTSLPSGSSSYKTIEAGLHVLNANPDCFQLLPSAPKTHKFHLTIFHPNNTQQYYKAVQKEHRMLKNSLPPGVWVRIFEDRMDLLSVMIEGPKKTPYEDGMFFFDIQLSRDYPKSPPLCHYISYCSDRLNPNLYEDGKVCVSLLGTWTGRDSEMWGPKSSLLQVIVSIQGLILVPEPYFNEAGYEKQKETQQGRENSRMYNEMVVIKMVQATSKVMQNPPEIFRNEILIHFKENGMKMYERIKGWMELSKESHQHLLDKEKHSNEDINMSSSVTSKYAMPDFPLVPASRGFCLTLAGLLESFKNKSLSNIQNMAPTTINTDANE